MSKPNIVFMLTDNIGYGDLGCYGGGITRGAPTPRLDEFATQGLRLTNFNVEAECTPTRSALLTGRMPIRTGCHRVIPPGVKQGMAPWEYTLTEMLNDAGYRSAIFGKWHLGNVQSRMPTKFGFEEWWGVRDSTAPAIFGDLIGFDPTTMDNSYLWEGKVGSPCTPVEPYTLDNRPLVDSIITDKSVEYIHKHANGDQPFFLYVPFSLVHHPAIPHPDFKGKTRGGDFADCMVECDHRSGQILDAISEAGIEDNTIVVWASDNGPILIPSLGAQADSGPWRGCLGTAYEGQLRTPCIIRWPGHVPAATVSDEMVSVMDFYRTFAEMLGISELVPTDRILDSYDQSDLFLGKTDKGTREHLLCFIKEELAAIKWHQFKMHLIEFLPEAGRRTRIELNNPQLFNVEQDPKEVWDIMEPNTWIGEVMNGIMREFHTSVANYPHVPPRGIGPGERGNIAKEAEEEA
ncbi:MAG: sulfatase-like hydrolase/transferase [Pseudomonadales bacterium]|nr:sulfatase-like hydrolase/transferase [Pseudomonadales bacterium]